MLDDDAICRYYVLGYGVKGLGHVERIKDAVRKR
jgi:hypothetical protein